MYIVQAVPYLIAYMHARAGFPLADTWIEAINKIYYYTCPGITPERVIKYLPKSEET